MKEKERPRQGPTGIVDDSTWTGIYPKIEEPRWVLASSASEFSLLRCSDSFGAPRGTRTGERGREVGILLGIKTKGTSICSKVTGKPLAMNPRLD
jgi:hypothetical protein